MAGTKRRRTTSKRFSPGVYQVAKILELKARQERAKRNLADFTSMVNTGAKLPVYDYTTGTFNDQTVQSLMDQNTLRGKGAYGWRKATRSAMGSIVHGMGGSRASGRKIGGLLYGAVRGATGGQNLYSGMGGYIPRTRGSGSYALNSLIQGSNVMVPQMEGGDEVGTITVTHKEFLGTISGSQAFENVGFSINPGLATTFPWLSQIAANYEEYDFQQLVFCYTSLLSDSTASGSVGQIIMTTNYNAGQQIYQTTNAMLNNIGTTCGRPIDTPMLHGVECDDEKNVQDSHFVRTGAVPQGQDVKTYDLGTFQIATEGMPEQGQLQGQLWVSYQVVLRKPRLFSALGRALRVDAFKAISPTEAYPFGQTYALCPANSIGAKLERVGVNSSFKVKFPVDTVDGIYNIKIVYRGQVQPQLMDSISYSQVVPYAPSANAYTFNADNDEFQQLYDTDNSLYFCTHFVALNGNNINPCEITYTFADEVAADRFNLVIEQLNPDINASTDSTIPPEWTILSVA